MISSFSYGIPHNTKLLIVIIDGLPYYLVPKKNHMLSFIHQKAIETGTFIPLEPILGYSDANYATLFTGTYPEVHGFWCSYSLKCNDTSSYPKYLAYLSIIDEFPSLIRILVKYGLYTFLSKCYQHTPPFRNIPFNMLNLFSYSEVKIAEPSFLKVPTLYDLLRKKRIGFAILNAPEYKYPSDFIFSHFRRWNTFFNLYKMLLQRHSISLVTVILGQADAAAHFFGLYSKRYDNALCLVDKVVKKLLREAENTW